MTSPAQAESGFFGEWSGTLALDGDSERLATLALTPTGDTTWIERDLPEFEVGVDLPAISSPELHCADYYRFEASLELRSDTVLDEMWSEVEVRVYPEGQGSRIELDVPFDDLRGTLREPAPATGTGRFGLSMQGYDGRWDGIVLWSDGATAPASSGGPSTSSVLAPIGTLEVAR
ncbi:MAG: hypothetical protein AAF602_03005 [Myxococcota bacterium]